MSNDLKLEFYFVSPLEVVKVTKQNMEQVAEWCGGRVATVESRRNPGRVDSYVWVPTPKGTQISWAFPGMFITKRMVVSEKNELKVTYSVFRRDYFERNYFASPNEAVDKTWERADKESKKKAPKAKERETEHSPLTEPREAEKHEEIAEQEAVLEPTNMGAHAIAAEVTEDREQLEKAKEMLASIPDDEEESPEEIERKRLELIEAKLEHGEIGKVDVDDTIDVTKPADIPMFVPPLLVEEPKHKVLAVPNHLK